MCAILLFYFVCEEETDARLEWKYIKEHSHSYHAY